MSPERAPFSSLSFPVGPLGIIAMDSCKEIAQKVDAWLLEERHGETGNREGLSSFFINSRCPRFSNGEDSLFLKEFMDKGYKVYTAPVTIGRECAGESTWFAGYNEKFFHDRGVLYHYLYGVMARPFALRFLLAHRDKMCEEYGIGQAYKWMAKGIALGKQLRKEARSGK